MGRPLLPTLTVAHWRQAPIRLHLSILMVAAANAVLGGYDKAVLHTLGLVTIIVFHEMGHALVARKQRLTVLAIDVHGYGGTCSLAGNLSEWQSIVVAWGGVLGQALLLVVPDLANLFKLGSHHPFWRHYTEEFIGPNVALILFNLLPIRGLDGLTAWRIVPFTWSRLRAKSKRKPRKKKSHLRSV